MKATLHKFRSGAPQRDLYEKGKDFEELESEVDCAEAKELLRQLTLHRDSVGFDFYGKSSVDFCFCVNSPAFFCVEITSMEFWATSDVDIAVAEQIIEHAYEGKEFTKHIPATNQEWNAYAFISTPINNDKIT